MEDGDSLDGNSPEGDSAAQGGWLALIGGGAEGDLGDDSAWSANVYGWIVEKANYGKVVIVAAQPQTEFLASYFTSLGASEAIYVTIGTTGEAADPQNLQHLENADAIFLKGGDQWTYLSAWMGSDVQTVLDQAIKNGKVLAGTSAGAHVLSGVAYDARNGSVRPGEALRNAFDSRITFTHGFLSVLPKMIVDTHFTERGRLARLAPMFARLIVSDAPDVRAAIGIDDRTALLVDPQGRAQVSGEGSVTVLQRTAETEVDAPPSSPPHVRSLRMDVLGDGYAIDLNQLEIVGHPSNATPVLVGPVAVPSTPVTLSGSDMEASKQGSLALEFESAYALFDGDLEVAPGTGALPGFVVVSQTFAQSQVSMVENRVGGVQWVLHGAGSTVPFSLLLDEGSVVTVDASGRFSAQSVESEPAVLVLDGLGLEETARTPYAPRQSVSLLGLRLHLLRSGDDWEKPKGR